VPIYTSIGGDTNRDKGT